MAIIPRIRQFGLRAAELTAQWTGMSKTCVMSFRLPAEVGEGLRRLAERRRQRPTVLGAALVEEGIRRRRFPFVEVRETVTGPVAYIRGTRLAIYWIVQAVGRLGGNVEKAAELWAISAECIRAALRCAAEYSEEIASDLERAEANKADLLAVQT